MSPSESHSFPAVVASVLGPMLSVSTGHSSYRAFLQSWLVGASAVCVHMSFQLQSFSASEASQGLCCLCLYFLSQAIPATELSCNRGFMGSVLSMSRGRSCKRGLARPVLSVSVFPSIPVSLARKFSLYGRAHTVEWVQLCG